MTVVTDPVEIEMQTIEDALAALRGADVTALRDESLEQAIAGGERLAARQFELDLRLLAEADNRDLGRRMGGASTAAWARHRFRLRPGTARSRLDLARRLASSAAGEQPTDWSANVGLSRAAGAMPATGKALAKGAISVDHAQVIASVMGRIPEHVQAEQVAKAEADLAKWALKFDPAGLARLGEHLLHVLDTQTLEEDEEQRVAKRELRLNEHTGRITGRLDKEAMAMLRTALDPLAAPCPADDGTPDPRSPSRRSADALIELARRACHNGHTLPTTRGTRPHLTITATLDTLQRARGQHPHGEHPNHEDPGCAGVSAGELAWGGPLSAEAVRRIACDAGITRIITNAHSVPLDVGREHRTVTTAQFAALVVRDGGCAFPGCTRPPAWCEAHHIKHWADGGATALNNLVLLCGHHHRSIHHQGWNVHLNQQGLPEFIPPTWIDPTQQPQHNPRPRPRHSDGLPGP
jgi:hypothetical protein